MATPVIMPRQGQSVESCIIGKWHVKKGDKVNEGDLLFTYETDKATFDETSKISGEVLDIYFEEGDDVPCLTNVCVIGNNGEDTAQFNPSAASEAVDMPSNNELEEKKDTVKSSSANKSKEVISSSDDATAVIMPRQGQSVESCIIGKWHKSVGDQVNIGDILFTYETDKATFDENSKVEGQMLAVFFEEGDDVPCLMNVCVIGKPGADVSAFDPRGIDEKAEVEPAVEMKSGNDNKKDAVTNEIKQERTFSDLSGTAISPRAKKLAKKAVADLRFAQPTGPKGRIIERDVLKLIESGKLATGAAGTGYDTGIEGTGIGGRVSVADLSKAPLTSSASSQPLEESYEEKHTNIRKYIAKAMHESISNMAQLTLHTSFDATDILELRAKIKKANASGMTDSLGLSVAAANPTINDIILYAVSRVIKNHRLCNAHYYDDKMVFFNTVNLGMAVDTPRGLMVPTIFGAQNMTVAEISANAKKLAADCQKGTISPDYLKGGTFTITNLGTMAVEMFTPVINPPQTCILGVNTLKTAVKDVNGAVVPYQSMGLSLTFDHRALDGAPAARFLKELKETLENFSLLMMG